MKKSYLKKGIFVGPIDAGTNESFKKMMEENGFFVTTCGIFASKFQFKNDINFGIIPEESRFKKIIKASRAVIKIFLKLGNYDVFHFRSGITLLPLNFDLIILKNFHKKIIMQYEGSDLRQADRLPNNPSAQLLAKNLSSNRYQSFKKRLKFRWIKLWADKIIVSTPDLLGLAPGAEFVQNFLTDENPFNSKETKNKKVFILHAPTKPKLKGTKFLLKAVNRLKREKYPVELLLLQNVPHDRVFGYYEKADIVLDQLLIGAYGVVSIEGMKYGKPCVCYIREDLRKFYPSNLPIISADPKNCYFVLKKLIEDKTLREGIGKESFLYFKKFHSQKVLSKKWLKIYQNL